MLECEVWRKVFLNKIIVTLVTLVTQGSSAHVHLHWTSMGLGRGAYHLTDNFGNSDGR